MTAPAPVQLVCRRCGRAVRYVPARFAYAHKAPGVDHPPVPVEAAR